MHTQTHTPTMAAPGGAGSQLPLIGEDFDPELLDGEPAPFEAELASVADAVARLRFALSPQPW